MGTQRHTGMAIVLHDIGTFGRLPKRHIRLLQFAIAARNTTNLGQAQDEIVENFRGYRSWRSGRRPT